VPFQKFHQPAQPVFVILRRTDPWKAEALTERQIGEAVFGKAAGYSPAE